VKEKPKAEVVKEKPSRAVVEDAGTLREEIDKLRKEFEEERSKRLKSPEHAREVWRGRIGGVLLLTLIIVMLLTFAYLVMQSRNFGELKMDEIVSVIPMVGTTLLTPLVGLVGAVTGFYFGGQVAAQASQATHEATTSAMKMVMPAGQPNAGQPYNPQ
jgi:hypothetical protein